MDEKSKEINISFLSPFERYQLVKPFIEEQERIAAQKEQESKLKETPVITTDDRIAAVSIYFLYYNLIQVMPFEIYLFANLIHPKRTTLDRVLIKIFRLTALNFF